MRRSKKGLPPTVKRRIHIDIAQQSDDALNKVLPISTNKEEQYQFFLENIDKDNSAIANMMAERFPGILRKSHMKAIQRWRTKLSDTNQVIQAA
jgi:hypothetical protein